MARRSCEAPAADGSGLAGVAGSRTRGLRGAFTSGPVLLAAFAFAIMGDPVSSVAYAMEAGLRSLGGRLALLVPTVIVVLGIIVLVAVNYHYLYARFPEGGGDAAASASAFSEGLAFLPLAALIVDYALTIAISVAAGASAIIAYVPRLAPARTGLAVVLLFAVAGMTLLGHGGRAVFAIMTLSFVVVGSVVIILGTRAAPVHRVVASAAPAAGHSAVLGVLVAFPVGMALATGVEAPSSAIAQLGQLDNAGRLRFGRTTLWLMVGIVVWLTHGIATLGVRLHQRGPAARGGQLIVPGRPGIAQGPRPRRGRGGHPARLVVQEQPPPHPLLGRRGVPRRLGGPGSGHRRPGTALSPVLRRGRVHRVLVRAGGDDPLLPPRQKTVAGGRERLRGPGGRADPWHRPRPRLPRRLPGRRLRDCCPAVLDGSGPAAPAVWRKPSRSPRPASRASTAFLEEEPAAAIDNAERPGFPPKSRNLPSRRAGPPVVSGHDALRSSRRLAGLTRTDPGHPASAR